VPSRFGDSAARPGGGGSALVSRSRNSELVDYEQHAVPRAVTQRLRSLDRRERRTDNDRTVTPSWSPTVTIRGLLVAQRWSGGDAFGCGKQIAELDLAIRRGAALHEAFGERGADLDRWPRPVRPQRGGLRLLDARNGSLDVLWTFYGVLVATASSTPVSLASFTSLAWTYSRSASRLARRWSVHRLSRQALSVRPSAADDPEAEDDNAGAWQERTTKRLMPLLSAAVDNGDGLDFRATGPGGEIRLIVPPRVTPPD